VDARPGNLARLEAGVSSNSANPVPVDAGRLWAGGAATAVVAGLIGFVGVLVGEGLLDVVMVRPPLIPIGNSFALRYAVTAGVLALVATAVAHLLLVTVPRPQSFFSWIVGLATVVGVVVPFTLEGTTSGRVTTAVVDLIIGLAVLSLLGSVMARTVRIPRGPGMPYAA
jgi:hypothetical protein